MIEEDLVGTPEYQPWLGAPALSYPNRPSSLPAILDRAVRLFGENPFLIDGDLVVTYRQFSELVAGTVEALETWGLQPGERFALAAHNCVELAVAHFAAATGQFVFVGLNVRLAADQWSYQLSHSGARVAFGMPEYLDDLRLAAKAGDVAVEPLEEFAAQSAPWRFQPNRYDEADSYAIVYTSGTTGQPKASQFVQRCSIHSGLSYQRIWQFDATDVCGVVFPLYYVSAMHAHVLPTMVSGGQCVLISEPSPTAIAKAVANHGITILYLVPALWLRLLRMASFVWPEVSTVRVGAFGGSPMAAEAISALRERLPQMRLFNVYGLSETHSPATMLTDMEMHRRPESVGRPLPCMEAKVVDGDGNELPANEVGELWLRGSLVTTGYFGDVAATEKAITDGWFHSGDVARIDTEGYVFVLDRLRDMIIRGGNKVFSAEVERLLMQHPLVDDAAVVGVPERSAGEAVVAYVVCSGDQPTVSELRSYIANSLASYAAPKTVVFVDELPRNPTGKVQKAVLRRQAEANFSA